MATSKVPSSAFDVAIKAISIVSAAGNATDIQYLCERIKLTESMILPIVYGEVEVLDGLNLIDKLPITGFDNVLVDFANPNASKPITKSFRIYNIKDRRRETNSGQRYVIQFCSEELFLASQYLLAKSYKGKTITDIVKDICMKDLKIKNDRIDFDSTKGIYDIILPYMKPFEAIQYISRRALSTKSSSPTFMFWETLLDGFKFKPWDDQIRAQERGQYVYKQAKIDAREINPFVIITYEVLRNFDTISDQQSGKYAANLMTLDFVRQRANNVILDNTKEFEKNAHLDNGQNKMVERENRKSHTPNVTPDSHSRLLFTTLDQSKQPYIKDHQPDIKPHFIEQTELQRNSVLQNFNDLSLRIVVPGNMTLRTGDIITLTLPGLEPQGRATTSIEGMSGRYLIAKMIHFIDERKFTSELWLIKDDTQAKNFVAAKNNPILSGLMGF